MFFLALLCLYRAHWSPRHLQARAAAAFDTPAVATMFDQSALGRRGGAVGSAGGAASNAASEAAGIGAVADTRFGEAVQTAGNLVAQGARKLLITWAWAQRT